MTPLGTIRDSTDVGLQLINSNRVEILQQEFASRLLAKPLSSVFDRERVIVPSMAMARWLNLQMANRHGVAANFDYQLPAQTLWQLAAAVLEGVPERDPLDRRSSSWRIFAALPDLLAQPAFDPLANYLRDDASGVKRWQLAVRIADVFDRYQFHRAELIRSWSSGESGDWQAILWRVLIRDLTATHRVALVDRLVERLQHPLGSTGPLPERLSLFAIPTLAPVFVDMLRALAGCMEVTFYLHSPTDQYWADLHSRKSIARSRLEKPDEADYYDSGNDLLASWGRQGQALQDLLLADDMANFDQDAYVAPGGDLLLHKVQQSIFSLVDLPRTDGVDGSIEVSICHGPFREVQVLHDRLLATLDEHQDLKPEDILVMVPDISRYAPYIEAVFDESAGRPTIPWNLSDTIVADEHPLIRTFQNLMKLPLSRFTGSEILSFLDVPEVASHFGLDESGRNEVRELLGATNIRWGIDTQHKKKLGLPERLENTWQQTGERLFSGFAMGEIGFWQGIAPVGGVEGARAVHIGRFWRLFDQLVTWRGRLSGARPASDWQLLLNELMNSFFGENPDEEGKLQEIRDAVAELVVQAGNQELSLELVALGLEDILGGQTVRGRFFTGGVTFCGMRPMRSLPFEVIGLLGMNDEDFPRRPHPGEFDLMAHSWRQGDPRPGDEDRYLMLETLLCARRKLYISYTGRSIKDDSERQPSVLVRELLDHLDQRTGEGAQSDDDRVRLSGMISRQYPMQPFSVRNYQSEADLEAQGGDTGRAPQTASYDRYWCQIAHDLSNSGASARKAEHPWRWPKAELTPAASEVVQLDLSELHAFYNHPVRYFFNNRLRVYLDQEGEILDDESFGLNALDRWKIKSSMAEDIITGEVTRPELYAARGELPHGSLGRAALEDCEAEFASLRDELESYALSVAQPKVFDLLLGNAMTLTGQLNRYLPGKGLLHYTPSKLHARNRLGLWLDHLALSAIDGLAENETSTLICSDARVELRPLPKLQALGLLEVYVQVLLQGLRRPLPLVPEVSYLLAARATESKILGKWKANEFNGSSGEEDDPYVQLVLQGAAINPCRLEEFSQLADRVFVPLLLAEGAA